MKRYACVACGRISSARRCPACRYTRPRGSRWRSQRARIIERDGYRCRRCGTPVSGGRDTHVDHIHPLVDGGATTDGNLETLCAPCNLSKGARR